jgi:predicted dehydrogenase
MNFSLIGDGYAAKFHSAAIKSVGGTIDWSYDPKDYYSVPFPKIVLPGPPTDFAVVASPSDTHRQYTKELLAAGYGRVICEKPLCMPWEPLIDDDRVSVTLQYRFADLPAKANEVHVVMVRDFAYFDTWKGDPRLTGGMFFNLFIHYIDLAIELGADFYGRVVTEGKQVRAVDGIDLFAFDTQELYNRMYSEIVNSGGIKPRDLFYLHYIMDRVSREHGYGKMLMWKEIFIPKTLL